MLQIFVFGGIVLGLPVSNPGQKEEILFITKRMKLLDVKIVEEF